MHSRRRFRDFALLLPLTTSCQLWVDEYAADREDPVDVTELCDVEQSVFDVDLRLDSNDHLATLEEYYAEANPDLVEQFETVTRNFTELAPVRTATYLMGEAGAGKSFMMRRLVNAFPE